jgi:DNA-binding XRE family transcriptional regulator
MRTGVGSLTVAQSASKVRVHRFRVSPCRRSRNDIEFIDDDRDTVTLSQTEYETLLIRLEDAEDNARLREIEAAEQAQGKGTVRADYLPIELVDRLITGEHPIRVWRQHRGLTRKALATSASVAPSYVTEIETGKKRGSFDALAKLAAALKISLDDIAAWTTANR